MKRYRIWNRLQESFVSVSQETLASAEQMLSTSDDQNEQMKRTHEVGLKLNELLEFIIEND
ncbi:hypothetical protein KHA80_17230 [Anaerobacillus sp. HL2]|nr:hypothetical protein KHA80_17230 [Anaerobacillus sp. HL2]